jgi:hypothetical protein
MAAPPGIRNSITNIIEGGQSDVIWPFIMTSFAFAAIRLSLRRRSDFSRIISYSISRAFLAKYWSYVLAAEFKNLAN